MRWRNLLRRAEAELEDAPFPYRDFTTGGSWMAVELSRRLPRPSPLPQPDYRREGIVKYGLSVLAAAFTLVLTVKLGYSALLLSVIGFYLVEVHFLFLFPLLAEGDKQAYLTSIRITHEIGVFHCLVNVIPIALTMSLGLLDREVPYRGWHVGCLAVVLWYVDYRKGREHER